jgi:hypothetical protein
MSKIGHRHLDCDIHALVAHGGGANVILFGGFSFARAAQISIRTLEALGLHFVFLYLVADPIVTSTTKLHPEIPNTLTRPHDPQQTSCVEDLSPGNNHGGAW